MVYGNIGKERSKFGEYADRKGITLVKLVSMNRISKNSISKACNTDGSGITITSRKILVEMVNELTGENKRISDFW